MSWLTGGSISQSQKILRIFFKTLGFYVSRGSVWWLVRKWKVQSRGVHRDFRGSPRDFLAVRLSNREKHLENISNLCFLSVLVAGPGNLHTTWLRCENRMFCILRAVFKIFQFFPRTFVSFHCLPCFTTLPNSSCLSQKLHFSSPSQHQSSQKRYGFFSFH